MNQEQLDKQNARNNEWQKGKYDRINAVVYRGEKKKIQQYLKENHETMSGFLNKLIATKIKDFNPIISENMHTKK